MAGLLVFIYVARLAVLWLMWIGAVTIAETIVKNDSSI